MSNNIVSWKTKDCIQFRIKREALYDNEDWVDRIEEHCSCDGSEIRYDLEDTFLEGSFKNGYVHVDRLELSGDQSGSFFHNVILPALEHSTGYFRAYIIFESGEIKLLTVGDGNIYFEEHDL